MSVNGTVYLYVKNLQGDIIGLTDTSGNLVVEYHYDAWGNPAGVTGNLAVRKDRRLTYAYDGNGNIVSVTDGSGKLDASYRYDELDQLIREDNRKIGKTFLYTYDAGGNLTGIREYAYTTADTPGTPLDTVTAEYDSVWKDKLVRWDGATITYDAIGNMLDNGRGMTFGWTQGRKLSSVTKDGTVSRYVYDHTGMRTKKTVGSTVTECCYAGRLLLSEKTGNRTNFYHYDSSANLIALTINGTMYFYIRNLQGDVLALVDTAGNTVVEYQYDPWGKPLGITGSKASTVGVQNPFRYRGYYYDSETGLYYIVNRFYDPEIRRFVCADNLDVLRTQQCNMMQYNVFIYCNNNPLKFIDVTGEFAIMSTMVNALIGAAVNTATSWLAAKVTGQEFDWGDAIAAAASGAVSSFGVWGTMIASVFSGSYTYIDAREGGASMGQAFLGGVAAAYGTMCIGGLPSIGAMTAGLDELSLGYVTNTATSLIFATGGNVTSTAIVAGATSNKKPSVNGTIISAGANNVSVVAMSSSVRVKKRIIGYGCKFDGKTGEKYTYPIYAY